MKKCWDIIWLSIGISISITIVLSSALYNRRKIIREFKVDEEEDDD